MVLEFPEFRNCMTGTKSGMVQKSLVSLANKIKASMKLCYNV